MTSSAPIHRRRTRLLTTLATLAILGAIATAVALRPGAGEQAAPDPTPAATPSPALTVRLVGMETSVWPDPITASGSILAWQESVIGAEIDFARITEVSVEVGDRVQRGQVLARIATDTAESALEEARAAVLELTAAVAEAASNATRAGELAQRGYYSTQANIQFSTAEETAAARLNAARARLKAAELRMEKTQVTAPDDGVIAARAAVVGSLTQPGQELFRLIRGGRLEWRAELPSADLAKVTPGASATLIAPNGEAVVGKVRVTAPSVDPRTRNGLVYVDLPESPAVRAGMFALGEIALGERPAVSLPESAVVLREGFAYAFEVPADGPEVRAVTQRKLSLGRRRGHRVEVVAGLDPSAQVVERGGGFLADGDLVRVVSGDGAR